MKNRLWLLQIPIVVFMTFCFAVTEWGERGELENALLRERLYPILKTISAGFTDRKFVIRGVEAPKNKIVIVDVDNASIEELGRWPWHRDVLGFLISQTLSAGAKVVGLDIVFSEPDVRVPDELASILRANKMGSLVQQFETDGFLRDEIARNPDRIVTGWMTDIWCQPKYSSKEECPVNDPEYLATHPKGFSKFGYNHFIHNKPYVQKESAFPTIATFIPNLEMYNKVSNHSGYLQVFPDPDGTIRRSALFMMADGKPYVSLALEMARVALQEEVALELDQNQMVKEIRFDRSKRAIPVNKMGVMDMNFRGPERTFQYVSAIDVMRDDDEIKVETMDRRIASVSKTNLLKDALVIIGVTAVGVNDMRSFPFDGYAPGVEGQATILDNILAADALVSGTSLYGSFWVFVLMILGALGFAYLTQRLEAVPALLVAIGTLSGFGAVDQLIFFNNGINWNTGFLYIEVVAIFFFVLSVKYVLEERNKKFIKGAFAKYVAPAIVDSILKDPSKLTVGGERRELTILFSDIRGFTTLSEKMDAKSLANFLNDYLGIMTDLVFEHEGTLDKYIGDAVMAFWGAPLDQPMHAYNSCRAAVEMIRALKENHARIQSDYGVDVKIGIGINSGPVNVGNMGSSSIFEYTVIGDHVNLASRLEGLTKAYRAPILTTRFTFDLIPEEKRSELKNRVLDSVKVKGKKQAVEIIELITSELSSEALNLFEEARQNYLNQNWKMAIQQFESVVELTNGEDGPSSMYIERCEYFQKNPPGDSWDGSWEMTTK